MTPAASGAPRGLDVRFPGPDRELAGTLTVPDGVGRFPAAVLVSGSGPVDRNSDAPRMPLGIARQLANALAGVGVASLRYDKRGVGDSRRLRDGTVEAKNGWKRAGLFDNADDVAAAFTALAVRPEVDPERVFLIGHSEGAALVTLTAARLLADPTGPQPAGVVLLSAAATPGDAVLRWQVATLAPTLPAPVRGLLRLTRTDLVAKVSKNHDKLRRTTTDVARMGLVKINAKWFREYLDYDPRPDLARLDVPVLAITGSKDLQVNPDDLAAIAGLVRAPVQAWCAPDVSHLLRTQPGPPSLRAYKKEVRRPVDPTVLDRVTGWLTDQLGVAPGPLSQPATGALLPSAAAAADDPYAADTTPLNRS
ncbi:MAG: alpha/beta fold hydrolase [Blastococcus sp.]